MREPEHLDSSAGASTATSGSHPHADDKAYASLWAPLAQYASYLGPERIHYGAYFVLGAGILWPWNAWISASDYWNYLYPDAHVDRIFAVCYFFPNLITLVALAAVGDEYAERIRVRGGFMGYLGALIAVPFIDLLFLGRGGNGNGFSLFLTLLLVIVTGVSDAVAQGSLFGRTAAEGKYTQALMGGTAASGLIVSVLRIFTKLSVPASLGGTRISTAVYFVVAGLVCLACLAIYDHLPPPRAQKGDRGSGGGGAIEVQMSSEVKHAADADVTLLSPALARSSAGGAPAPPGAAPSSAAAHAAPFTFRALFAPGGTDILRQKSKAPLALLGRLKRDCFAIFLVFAVTLSIFPGVLAEDVKAAALGDWFGILLIACFNLFDFVGKMLPLRLPAPVPKFLLWGSIGRLGFLPVYLISARGGAGPVFMSLLTALFGCTNGLLATWIMMVAPSDAALLPGKESELGGTLLVCFLMLGLTVGAFTGWLWLL